MTFRIDPSVIEEACKNIIETILFSLPNAFKGTVYLIGPPPELRAVRVTSGIISPDRTAISWGLPQASDYNPPGKSWSEYRDEPNRALEAMGWCVERQKSWTAEDPTRDARSVSLQVGGSPEDSHHMEPVLVRKEEIFMGQQEPVYPINYQGEVIWKDSPHVVVAVIKIHFYPHTIRIGSAETKVIKKLSRILGTELLSQHLMRQALEAIKQLAEERLETCNILAHNIRNAITKSGLILSLMKLELGFLRMQYEELYTKGGIIAPTITSVSDKIEKCLNMLSKEDETFRIPIEKIISALRRLKSYYIKPDAMLNWTETQVIDKWNDFLNQHKDRLTSYYVGIINHRIQELKRAVSLINDPAFRKRTLPCVPPDINQKFVDLLYSNSFQNSKLDELIDLLDTDAIPLPFLEKSRRSLIHLRALMQVIQDLEFASNKAISEIKAMNGNY